MVSMIYRWNKISFQRKTYEESNKCKQWVKIITNEDQHQKNLLPSSLPPPILAYKFVIEFSQCVFPREFWKQKKLQNEFLGHDTEGRN